MIPIRNAFDQKGRERFLGAWTGEELALLDDWPSTAALALFPAGKRAAFDRCTATIAQLQADLETGRAVVITTGAHHELHSVSENYWRDGAYNGRWQDGAQSLAEYLTDPSTSHYVQFTATKLEGPGPGAPPKYEKEDLRNLFIEHCKVVGFPSLSNEKNWQRQADVARWLAIRIEETEGTKPDEKDGTLKRYAKEFMEKSRSAKKTQL